MNGPVWSASLREVLTMAAAADLKCPRGNGELAADVRRGLRVRSCPTCMGMWLEREALARLEEASALRLAARQTARAVALKPVSPARPSA